MSLSLWAFIIGFAADLLLGDPLGRFHPVVAIGKLISAAEKLFRKLLPATPRGLLAGGVATVVLVCLVSLGLCAATLGLCYTVHPLLGLAFESFVCWQCLAARSLRDAAMEVYTALKTGTTDSARAAVGRIVGRDSAALDNSGVCRACVETVAENCSDGVIAPMLFMAIGGAPLGVLYKAINTMDSMLGYKSEKYLYFGRAAARLDDAANFIPARLAALAMMLAAALLGLDAKNSLRIFRRDRFKHASPNSAQTESVCAGALGLRLGGPNMYFGKLVDKPYIGDECRSITAEDIILANRLMLLGSGICFAVFLIAKAVIIC